MSCLWQNIITQAAYIDDPTMLYTIGDPEESSCKKLTFGARGSECQGCGKMCTTRAVLPQHETNQSSGFIYNGHNGGISEDLPSKPRDIWIDYVATSLRDRWNDAEKRVSYPDIYMGM